MLGSKVFVKKDCFDWQLLWPMVEMSPSEGKLQSNFMAKGDSIERGTKAKGAWNKGRRPSTVAYNKPYKTKEAIDLPSEQSPVSTLPTIDSSRRIYNKQTSSYSIPSTSIPCTLCFSSPFN